MLRTICKLLANGLDKERVMSKKFAGKIAVVTGASTGMGLATAKRFVQEGMDHVFITGRRKDALDAAVAEIGKNVTAVQGDVARRVRFPCTWRRRKRGHGLTRKDLYLPHR
jgi:shikimate 5-dehydrogenase